MSDLSIYVHHPFCRVRCAYCDFNTYAGLDDLMTPYARALAREIRMVGTSSPAPDPSLLSAAKGRGEEDRGVRPVHTVFFGGGTPSLLPLELHAGIFAALRESFELTSDCEITLEANPGTVDLPYLEGLRALGVNRLSFGVQSAHPSELKLLDRLHSFDDVVQAVHWARAAGFFNLNLDLIFGIPHQTLNMWQETLTRVLALQPEHLSCYALSLEHGTPMRSWVYRGLLPMPDSDLAAEMYVWASETLEAHGFVQYEISNWARCEKSEVRSQRSESALSDLRPLTSDLHYACRHNLQYWCNWPYLGFGAGAHGCVPSAMLRGSSTGGYRYSNVLAPAAYIGRVERGGNTEFPFSPALAQAIPVTREEEMGETMMLGMRLTGEGVRDDGFRERYDTGLAEKYPRELRRLKALGLIEWDADGARLTKTGRLLGNRVFREFV
jgi:oxygen-independent coproporphyrinogen-3 oxidase